MLPLGMSTSRSISENVHLRCVFADFLFDLCLLRAARDSVRCHGIRVTLRLCMCSFLLQILLGTKIYLLGAGIIPDAHSDPRWHADEPSRIPLDPLDRNSVREWPITRVSSMPQHAYRIGREYVSDSETQVPSAVFMKISVEEKSLSVGR